MLKANQTSQDTLPMSSVPPTVAAAAGAADSSDEAKTSRIFLFIASSKASLGKYLEDAIKTARISQGQTYLLGRSKSKEEFEQDISTQAAHLLSSNPVLLADKNIRTELGSRISLQAQVQYRDVEGKKPKAMSYKEAYALQTSKSKSKSSLLHAASSASSDVPDGSNFLRNSNKSKKHSSSGFEKPAAKDPNRARRNGLASNQLEPPIIDVDSPPAAVVPSDPVRAIHARLRKRCAKDLKNHRNKSAPMTPSTCAKTRFIHTGLTSNQKDPYIKSVVADELDGSLEFPSSQDVLQGIKDTIETPRKSL
jgi:hypothetical protein